VHRSAGGEHPRTSVKSEDAGGGARKSGPPVVVVAVRPGNAGGGRGGGLRQRESDTRPYTERTLPVTNRLARFTRMACRCPLGRHESPGAFPGRPGARGRWGSEVTCPIPPWKTQTGSRMV
jgi:hypothetical protein